MMARFSKSTQSVDPKKLTEFDKCVEAVASQKVPITKNGQSKEMTAMEAVLQKQFMTAIAGSPHAQNQFLRNVQHTEQVKREIMEKDIEDWTRNKRYLHNLYKAHREQHGCDPEIYPHPDDIVICDEKGVSIIGPMDEKEALNIQDTLALVDAMLYQHALDRARNGRIVEEVKPGDLSVVAHVLNFELPKRLQRSDDEMLDLMMKLGRRPIRVLLKETYAAWKATGHPQPRGAYGPAPEKVVGVLNLFKEITQWILENKQDTAGLDAVVEAAFAKHML